MPLEKQLFQIFAGDQGVQIYIALKIKIYVSKATKLKFIDTNRKQKYHI